MTTITVYDPPMCCSTGVCGAEVDQRLVTFAADLDWLKSTGVAVRRINLAQEPQEFVAHPEIRALMDRLGGDALPAILIQARSFQSCAIHLVPSWAALRNWGPGPPRTLPCWLTSPLRRVESRLLRQFQQGCGRVRENRGLLLRRPREEVPCSPICRSSCSSPARAAWARPPSPARRPCSWPGRASACCSSAPIRPPTWVRCSA